MEETNRKHDGKKRTVIIAVVVVAALVAGGLVWWGVASHRAGTRLAQARQACEWAQTDYTTMGRRMMTSPKTRRIWRR